MEEPSIKVLAWARPSTSSGVAWGSHYLFDCWSGLLGPSACVLVHLLADRLASSPQGYEVSTALIASWLGVGARASHETLVHRSLARASRYGFVTVRGTEVGVSTSIPFIPERIAQRLAPTRRAAHRRVLDDARRSACV